MTETPTITRITLADIERCPHRSLSALHYRPDATCLCRDDKGNLLAVVVTVEGSPSRRYVVVDNYDNFAGVPSGRVPEPERLFEQHPLTVGDIRRARENHLGRFSFGCQWLRSLGKVDEMHRTLSTWEVVKLERLPYVKVWGSS